ncbi:hypothetical protein BDV93DRAFT_542250 [Ceratobasidium sp. AG-I]|nr:hypothetical protein BDV93DRAFT_542250 [Ceratobasidium sp. AG-I]
MSAPVLEDGAPTTDASVPESIPSTLAEDAPATPVDIKQPSEQELALQAEVAQLRKQLEQKTQIPFGVHLFSWFTSPPIDNPDGDPAAPLPPHRQKHKRKSCPHCRGAVRSRPVELFGMGSVVAALVGQPGPAVASASTSAAKAVESPAGSTSDPWSGLFPPTPAGHALRDDADGVLRCPSCFHEIWDGECVRCGRMFSDGGSGQSAFGSDDGSISVYGDGVGSIYGGGGGSIFGGSLDGLSDEGEGDSVYGSGPDYPQLAYVPRALAYDSYDEDEDEDDSIDDVELPRPPPAAYFNHYAASDSDRGENADVRDEDDGYRSPPPVTLRASSEDSQFDEDERHSELLDDDEEEDDFLPPRGRRGRSADSSTADLRPRSGIETAEEADDEDDEDGPNHPSHANPTTSSNNPNATVDLVSSDSDAPVRPAGRRAAAARWGWSSQQRRRIDTPEFDSGSESEEYFSDGT